MAEESARGLPRASSRRACRRPREALRRERQGERSPCARRTRSPRPAPGGRASPSANSPASGMPLSRMRAQVTVDVVASCCAARRPGPSSAQYAAALPCVGHADAARVDEPRCPPHLAVELHVRVAEHDRALRHAGEHRSDARRGRERRHDLLVVARRGVAEEHVTEPVDLGRGERRQGRHPVEAVLVEHSGSPVRARRPDVVGIDARAFRRRVAAAPRRARARRCRGS